jgi:ABC-2 type transport system permease protein
MIADILTVMWKEWKMILHQQEGRRDTVASMVIPVICMAALAVFPPLAMGADWVRSPLSLTASLTLPLLTVGIGIADSFAGERERHTLETLLACRLPDRAILFGKMGVAVLWALALTSLVHLVGLVALNICHAKSHLLVYSPLMALANLVLGSLTAIYAACLGVSISLRATTVQQALQRLMAALISPILLMSIAVTIIGEALPAEVRAPFEEFIMNALKAADLKGAVLGAIAVLIAVDLGLLVAAMARFQRARLILD